MRNIFAHRKNDSGFMSAEWLMGIGLLIFPAFVIALSIVQVPSRVNLAKIASAAAAQAYVQTLDQSQADAAAKTAAVEAIIAEYAGPEPSTSDSAAHSKWETKKQKITDQVGTKILISASKPNGYCPGEEVSVTVSMPIPVMINPFGSGADPYSGIRSKAISSTSTKRIDDYADLADSDSFDPPSSFDYDTNRDPCGP